MDTRQLKTLLAIAESGGFSRAAEMVHLTVSAVSQQIQALEQEVGASLFDRSSRPPRLTAAGQQMVEAARELVRGAENAIDAISGRRVVGTLAIGSVRSSAMSLLPQVIVGFRAEYPDLRIKLRVSMSETLLQDVLAGRLDAAMVAEQGNFPPGLRWRPFLREPLFVAAPPDAPALTAPELLARYPYIRLRSNVPLAHMIDLELARLGIALTEVAEIDTIAAIVPCVAHGLGVSVLPKLAIEGSAQPLVRAPFGTPRLYRRIGLVEQRSGARALLTSELHRRLVAASGEDGAVEET